MIADAGVVASAVTVTERPAAGPVGNVVEQEPAFGSLAPTAVTLVAATEAVVPEAVGRPAADVTSELGTLGAQVTRQLSCSAGAQAGTVLGVDPLPSSTKIIACSGAIAADVTARNRERDVPAQIDQLKELMKDDVAPGLVLFSLGGNDAGFGDIIKSCFSSADGTQENLTEEIFESVPEFSLSSRCSQDPALIRRTEDRLEWLADDLSRKIVAIDATVNTPGKVESRGGWRAPVVVMACPQIVPSAVQPNHTTCDVEACINPLSAIGAYLAGGKDAGSTIVPDVTKKVAGPAPVTVEVRSTPRGRPRPGLRRAVCPIHPRGVPSEVIDHDRS